jgi:hypothetical protein
VQSACEILPSVGCPALPNIYTLSHKRHDFRDKKSLNTKYVLGAQFLSETFLNVRITQQTVTHVQRSACAGLTVGRVQWNCRQIGEKSL